MSGILFYPSKNHNRVNGADFSPDVIVGRAMVAPAYKATLCSDTKYIIDSEAFRDKIERVPLPFALGRQLRMMEDIGMPAEAIVTYDRLLGVDEVMVDGVQIKRRGTEATAVQAVRETIAGAEFYHRCRDFAPLSAIAYAAQGVTTTQYLACVAEVLKFARPGIDWLALGGFCILGMQNSLLPLFEEICTAACLMAHARGITHVHILGVCWHLALQVFQRACDAAGVIGSTDSSSIELNSIHGSVWDVEHMRSGGSPWRHVYKKAHKLKAGGYHPCHLALANMRRFTDWCETLAAPRQYQPPLFAAPVQSSRYAPAAEPPAFAAVCL